MKRTDFDFIIKHFSNTIGTENNNIQFYKLTFSSENMGLGGGKLEKYKLAPAIVLINSGAGLKTEQGKQQKTINASCRSKEPDLLNTYFYYKGKRYKIIEKQNIEGRSNNVDFFHYGAVEG